MKLTKTKKRKRKANKQNYRQRGYLVSGETCPFCHGTGKIPDQDVSC